MSTALVRDAAGQPLHIVTHVQDITERQEAEETLRASEARYRLLFQSLQEGFYLAEAVLDPDGHCRDAVYLDVNPAFERIMGRPREQIIGRRMLDLVPQLKPEWLEVFGHVTRTGEPRTHQSYSTVFGQYFEAFVFRPAGHGAVPRARNLNKK